MNGTTTVPQFVKVIPHDYKRMQEAITRVEASGLSGEEALLAAFEENAQDTARAGAAVKKESHGKTHRLY